MTAIFEVLLITGGLAALFSVLWLSYLATLDFREAAEGASPGQRIKWVQTGLIPISGVVVGQGRIKAFQIFGWPLAAVVPTITAIQAWQAQTVGFAAFSGMVALVVWVRAPRSRPALLLAAGAQFAAVVAIYFDV